MDPRDYDLLDFNPTTRGLWKEGWDMMMNGQLIYKAVPKSIAKKNFNKAARFKAPTEPKKPYVQNALASAVIKSMVSGMGAKELNISTAVPASVVSSASGGQGEEANETETKEILSKEVTGDGANSEEDYNDPQIRDYVDSVIAMGE